MQTKNLFKTFFYLRCYTIVRYSDIVESGVKGRLLEKFGKLLEKFSKIRIYSTMRGWEENVYFRLENMFKVNNKIMILIWRMCPRLTLRQLWTNFVFINFTHATASWGTHSWVILRDLQNVSNGNCLAEKGNGVNFFRKKAHGRGTK